MGYRKPENVVAPKSRWELRHVLCNTGQGGWAVAEGIWDKEPSLGVRWNGDDDSGSHGSPQSHGNPTWFIVPSELEEAVRNLAHKCNDTMKCVDCSIDRPEGFEYGVFLVTLRVKGELYETIKDRKVAFNIPRLPNRFFRTDAEFLNPYATNKISLSGLIIKGEWKSIVQTNGIEEEKNPTEMDVVKDALIANILQALKPFE